LETLEKNKRNILLAKIKKPKENSPVISPKALSL
jgi:hypothetical protein